MDTNPPLLITVSAHTMQKQMIKNLHRLIHFHSKRPHTITKRNNNINMNSTITESTYACYRVLKMCQRFSPLFSHFPRLKIYRAWVFQQFLCLCELSLSRFVDLYLLIDYFYYCNQPNTNKSAIFLIYLTPGDVTVGTPDFD